MKAHPLFDIWRPDEVAECLDGVGTELYSKLWTFVGEYKGLKPELAEEPTPGVDCLAGFWDRLTENEQVELNALAHKQEEAMRPTPRGWDVAETDTI